MTPARSHRVALVSGGGSGIGLAVVTQLLADGFAVGFFGRTQQTIDEAQQRLAERLPGDRYLGLTADVSSEAEVAHAVMQVHDRFGEIDTLVCSAGISPKGKTGATPFATLSMEEWNAVIAINLTGSMLCCQAVLPAMIERGFGRIVFVGSIAARAVPKLAGNAYAASKAGLAGFAKSLVSTTSGTGVTVNTVAPGHIVTGMTTTSTPQAHAEALARVPVGRLGTPEDVAAAVAFLASEQAGFIHGATLDVNGGEFVAP